MVKYELCFKRIPGRVDVSTSSTKKSIDRDIGQLRKFGYKKGKSATSLKIGQYFVQRLNPKRRKRNG